MAKRTKKKSSKAARERTILLPMEFNPGTERYEPVLPIKKSNSPAYQKTSPAPSSNEKRNWRWIIMVIILSLLILAYLL